MRLNRLDLNLLTVLEALFEELSVTRAADRLQLSQPATSNALNRLRDHFGDQLLVPSGRQLVPTPFAREIEEQVRGLVMQARTLAAARSSFDARHSTQRFRINVSDYTTICLMIDVMRRLATEAPRVVVDLDSATEGLTERFEKGTVDMIILPREYIVLDHPWETLFAGDYCCVVWKDNAKIGDTLTLEEYLDADHIGIHRRFPFYSSYDSDIAERLGYVRRIVGMSPNYSLLPLFVVGTDRIVTVQRRLAERAAREADLRLLPVPFDMPPLVECVQWHRYQNDDAGTIWMRRVLGEVSRTLTDYSGDE
jgi:DNA-binding transcriptional LysR family regulator